MGFSRPVARLKGLDFSHALARSSGLGFPVAYGSLYRLGLLGVVDSLSTYGFPEGSWLAS